MWSSLITLRRQFYRMGEETSVAHLCYIVSTPQETNMSTTTIRLPDELKFRVASAAQRAGVSSHNFILQAIAEKTDQEERRAEFDELVENRYAQILATGQAIPWEEMRRYLLERLSGQEATRPQARKR